MNKDIIDSAINEAKKRLSDESPFWSSFIISWLVINWKVLFIATSLNSTSINEKIDAIEKLYPSGFETIGSLIIYPFIASFIAVAIIPFINHVYLWFRKEFRDWDSTIEIGETKREIELIEVKKDLQEKEKELEKSKEDVWMEEFSKIDKKYPNASKELSSFIYTYGGVDYSWDNQEQEYLSTIDREIFKIFDINELIEFSMKDSNNQNIYILTEKGKFFLRKKSLEA